MKDIYGYLAKGVNSNPKKVIGYWATNKGVRLVPKPVGGNVNINRGTDFVVESIKEFFDDPWVSQINNIRIVIPSAWSKSGLMYYSNNNTGSLRGMTGE